MPRLKAATRKKLPAKEFGLKSERKYPVEDKSHARNAKSRASEEEHKGRLTKAQEREVDRAADRVLSGKGKRK